jgi:hypothetical protein
VRRRDFVGLLSGSTVGTLLPVPGALWRSASAQESGMPLLTPAEAQTKTNVGQYKPILERMVKDLIAIQNMIVNTVSENRGGRFHLGLWKPMYDIKENVTVFEGESSEVIKLYEICGKLHQDIIRSLTQSIRPEDEPWTENFQVPPILEIFYEIDPAFRKAVEKFVDKLMESDHLVDRMCFCRYSGVLGPTSVHGDSAAGSVGLYRPVLEQLDLSPHYKETIIAAVTGARNTSYTNLIGTVFAENYEKGVPWAKAVQLEKDRLRFMWLSPTACHLQTLKELGFASFDPAAYLQQFKQGVRPIVEKSVAAGVHYGNILTIANTAGGIEHHVGQMTLNMCKDDFNFSVYDAVARVSIQTIQKAWDAGQVTDPESYPMYAITAAATMQILAMDGWNVDMIHNLLHTRAREIYRIAPRRMLFEDLNPAFLEYIARGERVLKQDKGKVGNIEVDLSPIQENDVLMHPQRYTWGQTPITCRFSAVMRFADEPFQLINDPMMLVWVKDVLALRPKKYGWMQFI